MKTILTRYLSSACLLFVISGLTVKADETTHHKAAAELIALTSSDELFQSSFMLGLEPMMRQLSEAGVAVSTLAAIEKAGLKLASKIANDPEFKNKLTTLYKNAFTEDELRELTAFYKTPLGKKSLVKLPELMQNGAAVGMEVAEKHQASFEAELEKIMRDAIPQAPQNNAPNVR